MVIEPNGAFAYDFYDSYNFRPYLYVFGGSVISGVFVGSVQSTDTMMKIEGTVRYFYDDVFTDPASIREHIIRGTSTPEEAYLVERWITDGGGSFFPIKDNWQMLFSAEAKLNRETSTYRWESGPQGTQ